MLTRLHVQGFKNLLDVEVYFGPFTCIVGLNAVGKSNLFDAIRFLHLLTEKTLLWRLYSRCVTRMDELFNLQIYSQNLKTIRRQKCVLLPI